MDLPVAPDGPAVDEHVHSADAQGLGFARELLQQLVEGDVVQVLVFLLHLPDE